MTFVYTRKNLVNPYASRDYLTWNQYWDFYLKPHKEVFTLQGSEEYAYLDEEETNLMK